MKPLPSQNDLLKDFIYDPLSGELRRRGGRPILSYQASYRGEMFLKSRLIWKLTYGVDPDRLIDHKDGNPKNNSLGNLRLASYVQNAGNKRTAKNNALGIKGVQKVGLRYYARISSSAGSRFLGSYSTQDDAAEAYRKAAEEQFREFSAVRTCMIVKVSPAISTTREAA